MILPSRSWAETNLFFCIYISSEKLYWVGRRSLVRWKSLAVEQESERQNLIDRFQNTANHDTEEEDETKITGDKINNVDMGQTLRNGKEKEKESPQRDTPEEDLNEPDAKFNEDLLCEHG